MSSPLPDAVYAVDGVEDPAPAEIRFVREPDVEDAAPPEPEQPVEPVLTFDEMVAVHRADFLGLDSDDEPAPEDPTGDDPDRVARLLAKRSV